MSIKLANFKSKLPQLVALIAIVVVVGISTQQNTGGRKVITALPDQELLANLQQIDPNIGNIEQESPEVYLIANKESKAIGRVIIAQKTTSEIIGYGGPTPLAIIVDNDDTIEGIGLLPNDETPSYVKRIAKKGFFAKWKGLSAAEAVTVDMDAVSGATYTSEAVNETVKQRLAEYNSSVASARKIDFKKLAGNVAIVLVLLYALAFFFYPQRFNKYRISLLVASIAILGFAYGSFLSIKLITSWLMQGLSLSNQVIFITIGVLSLILPFVFGKNYYCTYVCPFGASQELLGRVCKKKVELPSPVTAVLTRTRSKVLLVVLALAVFGSGVEVSDAEPFSVFLFASAAKGVIVLAVLFLLISIVIPRAWCRFFCPTGALLDFLRKEAKDIFPAKAGVKTQLAALLVAIIFALAVFGRDAFPALANPFTKNGAIENIFERKSVRHFTDRKVSRQDVELLVKAGMAAPTARNRQPWAFVAITERATLDSLAAALPTGLMLGKATAAIAVCGDMTKVEPEDKDRWIMDTSAATENILLAAEALGLGAVWIGIYPEEDRSALVSRILSLPVTAKPLSVIAIGYPTGEDKPKDKFKPENLHWEKW